MVLKMSVWRGSWDQATHVGAFDTHTVSGHGPYRGAAPLDAVALAELILMMAVAGQHLLGQRHDGVQQRRLVGLDLHQDVITTGHPEAQSSLTVQCIQREKLAIEAKLLDQALCGGNLAVLVALGQRHLSKHQTLSGGKGRQPLQRCLVDKPVEAAAQGLAVDGDRDAVPAGTLVERRTRTASQRLLDRSLVASPSRIHRKPVWLGARHQASPVRRRNHPRHVSMKRTIAR
jgi:hypothetical protein